MRTFFAPLLHPERRRPAPQPRQVDLRRAVLVGLSLWAVAAATLAVVGLATDLSVRSNLVVCATGGGLGLLALVWEQDNRRRYRAVAETVDVVRSDPAAPAGSASTATGLPAGSDGVVEVDER